MSCVYVVKTRRKEYCTAREAFKEQPCMWCCSRRMLNLPNISLDP